MKQTVVDDVFEGCDVIHSDWIEFKLLDGDYINISRSQIEYVRDYGKCEVELGLKSGAKIAAKGKYKEILEML